MSIYSYIEATKFYNGILTIEMTSHSAIIERLTDKMFICTYMEKESALSLGSL